MIGLILNNFYLIINSIKINLLIIAICMISYILYPEQLILMILIFIISIMLPSSCFNIIAVTRTSKWNSIEKLFPFDEKKLLLSRYLSFLALNIVSMGIIVIISILHSVMFGVNFNETIISIPGLPSTTMQNYFVIYVIESHLIGILYFPLIHILKYDKNDSVLLISIGVSFPILYFVLGLGYFNLVLLLIALYILSFLISLLFIRLEKANL